MDFTAKTCTKCGETKSLSAFPKDKSRSSGIHSRCKACNTQKTMNWRHENPEENRARSARYRRENPDKIAAARLRYLYGLTPGAFEALREAQGFRCAICDRAGRLHVDHCHTTGKVRGLLCQACNTGLGKLGDTPAGLMRAMTYLTANG